MTVKKLTKTYNKVEAKINSLTDEQNDIFFDKLDESWKSASKYLGVSLKELETWMYCD